MCAPHRKLVVEVDGSQHLDQQEYNAERTVYLESHGYKVLRFGNGDVINNIEDVLTVILEELHPSGTKPPDGDTLAAQ
jgi:very-short-patch-repair endonuclease